jgi:hypothetical protein
MTTPTGQISWSNITAEFGAPPGKNLGAYRVSQSVAGRNWPLDEGIPSSGTISFSQLRGKTLNCVVDYSAEETNVDSGSKFDSSAVVIGGFKPRPSRGDSSQTKKVYHVVRSVIGATESTTAAALKTGTWDSSTTLLKYIVTSSGRLWGRGGNGGSANGGTGQAGSPALGVQYSCELLVESSGQVQGGGGGGGGGGAYSFNQNAIIGNYACSASGGAGGKGAGYNNQDGADGGNGPSNFCRASGNNCNGGGQGGGAGYGGNGGDWGENGNNGCPARTSGILGGESESLGSGGNKGLGGAAVVRLSSNLLVSVTNSGGTVKGSTTAVGSFT